MQLWAGRRVKPLQSDFNRFKVAIGELGVRSTGKQIQVNKGRVKSAKPDNLNLIPGICMINRKNRSQKQSSDLHACLHTRVHTHSMMDGRTDGWIDR